MPHRVGAGSQPALVERHQEADRACSRIVALGGGSVGLGFYERGDGSVERKFVTVDHEARGSRVTFGEQLARAPVAVGLALWKVDHRLFGASEVEGRTAAAYGFADRLHVGVSIRIEKLKEEAEVDRVALVR